MLKKLHKTLSIGLSGLLALSIGMADASDDKARREANILHEMVPHVILPETIQYSKTVKSHPGTRYTTVSPHVGTYVAYPSYQVPYSAAFRPVGQLVYPVSPQVPPPLPAPLPKDESIQAQTASTDTIGREIVLSNKSAESTAAEPIRLASSEQEVIPALPRPDGSIVQTGIFCNKPVTPPSAWAFSSPLFKIASTPSGWGGQTGSIIHNSPRGSGQQVGFMPVGQPAMGHPMQPAMGGMHDANPYGVPYSTVQMGRGAGQDFGSQVQILPNGMLLLTMPPTHHNCGLIRCRSSCMPRTILLPPAGAFPQPQQQAMMPMMPHPMQNAMMHDAMMQNAMMSGGMHGMSPFMHVNNQPMMPMMQPQMMQATPVMAMTPMGPAVVGYQQAPMPMMSPMAMMNPQIQMAMASPNPMMAQQMLGESGENALLPGQNGDGDENQMQLVATPFGYAIRVPTDSLQPEMASQLMQMQQMFLQSQMQQPAPQMQMPMQFQMPTNPYAGLYATPFGMMAMNQSAGQFGSLGQSSMFVPNQAGMSVSDMLQIIAFINSSKPQRRARLFERIAERREARRASAACNDPVAQMMQAWTTPYTDPSMTLQMPARNAYPYGNFGVQASPVNTANYGGYHNMYYGSTAYPGLY
ncbi:MAG: hypothetical protein FWG73_09400 [Planctomycetaceae bacterium]|nr:hypothetical protein [Planctomycetaceae bacterium]